MNTYRVVSLKTFLRKTLGGFASASTADHWHAQIAHLYPQGVKVEAILAETGVTERTLYNSLHRQGIPLRRQLNISSVSTAGVTPSFCLS